MSQVLVRLDDPFQGFFSASATLFVAPVPVGVPGFDQPPVRGFDLGRCSRRGETKSLEGVADTHDSAANQAPLLSNPKRY